MKLKISCFFDGNLVHVLLGSDNIDHYMGFQKHILGLKQEQVLLETWFECLVRMLVRMNA